MASIVTEKSGRRRVFFDLGDGKRSSVSLGQCTLKDAKTAAGFIVRLANHKRLTTSWDIDTVEWVRRLSDRDHGKLAAVGLVTPRQAQAIGVWLDRIIQEKTGELKPASLKKWRQTQTKLLDALDAKRDLRSITADEASSWRAGLVQAGLSVASVNGHVGFAKTMFNEAVRRKIISENPFEHLSGGAVASQSERYVTAEQIDAVLKACPNTRYKVLFALARYAGLRVPSESHLLTWADVDFAKGVMRVRSPKTERHAGHEARLVPIDPRLREILLTAQGEATLEDHDDADQRVCTLSPDGAALARFEAVILKAGVEPWAKLFQALRWSCEREWAMTYPQYAVSKWIGHSIAVSGRHYANHVPQELYAKASASGDDGKTQSEAVRQAVRAGAKPSRTVGNGEENPETINAVSSGFSSKTASSAKRRGGDSNSR